jgi:hypothetical protein
MTCHNREGFLKVMGVQKRLPQTLIRGTKYRFVGMIWEAVLRRKLCTF